MFQISTIANFEIDVYEVVKLFLTRQVINMTKR